MLQADIIVASVRDDEGEEHRVGVPALVYLNGYGQRIPVWISERAWPIGPAGFVMACQDIQEVQAAFRVHWPEYLHEVDWSILLRKVEFA